VNACGEPGRPERAMGTVRNGTPRRKGGSQVETSTHRKERRSAGRGVLVIGSILALAVGLSLPARAAFAAASCL